MFEYIWRQPLANGKGLSVRLGPEETGRKTASRWTDIAYKFEVLGEWAKSHETLDQGATVNAEVAYKDVGQGR